MRFCVYCCLLDGFHIAPARCPSPGRPQQPPGAAQRRRAERLRPQPAGKARSRSCGAAAALRARPRAALLGASEPRTRRSPRSAVRGKAVLRRDSRAAYGKVETIAPWAGAASPRRAPAPPRALPRAPAPLASWLTRCHGSWRGWHAAGWVRLFINFSKVIAPFELSLVRRQQHNRVRWAPLVARAPSGTTQPYGRPPPRGPCHEEREEKGEEGTGRLPPRP